MMPRQRCQSLVLAITVFTASMLATPTAAEARGLGETFGGEAMVVADLVFWQSPDGNDASTNPCPAGYSWDETNTNPEVTGNDWDAINLCVRYAPWAVTANPITTVKVQNNGDESGDPPRCGAGWSTVKNNFGVDQDTNFGAGGDYIYVCYHRSGDYPLQDVKIVPGFVGAAFCADDLFEDQYVRIGSDLTSGSGAFLDAYVCYSSALDAGFTWDCGGEGEEPCDADTRFHAENGSGGCDRGLSSSGGRCVNDDRRQSVADDFRTTWTHWALLNQVNDLASRQPIGTYTMVGAHNAFNNSADGYIDPNQVYSITDQLRAGIRVIDLDVHLGSTFFHGTRPYLCHGDENDAGCFIGDRLFDSAMKEIRHWMVQPENLDQTIVILLEDYVVPLFQHMVTWSMELHLGMEPKIGAWRTFDYDRERMPTRARMLELGKRVLILSQNEGYGSIAHQKTGNPQLAFYKGGTPIEDFNAYPVCSAGPDSEGHYGFNYGNPPSGFGLISEIVGDRNIGGADPIRYADLVELSECAVDFVNVDDVLAAEVEEATSPGSRLSGAVWSWGIGDWGHNGDAAAMRRGPGPLYGRWRSADTSEELHFACRAGESLLVTEAKGTWDEGWTECRAEFGTTAAFFVPTNGWANRKLYEACPSSSSTSCPILGSDVWLNYNDLGTEGRWIPDNQPPAVTVETPGVVYEGPASTTFTFTVQDDAPVPISLFGAPDCGAAGTLTPGSFRATAASGVADGTMADRWTGSFGCTFPSGGDSSSDTTSSSVSLPVVDSTGVVSVSAPLDVDVFNVAPTVSAAEATPASVDENASVSLDVSFVDPGADDHVVRIDWDDGSGEQLISVAAGARSITVDHTYLDDGPSGPPSHDYAVTVAVADERGPGPTWNASATVDNVAPVVELSAVTDELGNVLGTEMPVALTGLEVSVDGGFTDVGTLDTWVLGLDWGDGSPAEQSTSGSHRFDTAGRFTVALTVTDDDSGVGRDTSAVTVVAPGAAIDVAAARLEQTTSTSRTAGRALTSALSKLQGANGGAAPNGADTHLDSGRPGIAIELLELAVRSLSAAEAADATLDLSVDKDLLALTAKSIALGMYRTAEAAPDSDGARLASALQLLGEGDALLHAPTGPDHAAAIDRYGRVVLTLRV